MAPAFLGAIADNGGPTATRLPTAMSPFAGMIPAAECPLAADQRGLVRPQPLTGGCEPGAAEIAEPVPAVEVTLGPTTQEIGRGGSATFEVVVRNTGGTELTDVAVTDDVVADCARSGLGPIAVGASMSYSCAEDDVEEGFSHSVTATHAEAPAASSNVATVTLAPVVVPRASAAIKIGPASQVVAPGDAAVFTVTVTNDGETTLTNLEVTDASVPDCNRSGLGSLEPGTSLSYTCTAPSVTTAMVLSATVRAQAVGAQGIASVSAGSNEVTASPAPTTEPTTPTTSEPSTPTTGEPTTPTTTGPTTPTASGPMTPAATQPPIVADSTVGVEPRGGSTGVFDQRIGRLPTPPVQAQQATLPYTGADVGAPVGFALVLLASGVALVALARRRQEASA